MMKNRKLVIAALMVLLAAAAMINSAVRGRAYRKCGEAEVKRLFSLSEQDRRKALGVSGVIRVMNVLNHISKVCKK